MKISLFSMLVTIMMLFTCANSSFSQEGNPNSGKVDLKQPAASTETKTENPNPASIAILGIFHFAGSSGDAASMKVDGMLGERRQKEIEEVLVRLEKYKPDKVLVEYPYNENEQLNKDYQNYLNGDLKLTADETHQLGFRLAKHLGHIKIYGVDHELSLPSDKLQAFAETHGQKEKYDKFIADVQAFAATESKSLETLTILDCLTKMNTDESDRWNRGLYLGTFLEMGDEESNPGLARLSLFGMFKKITY